MLLLPVFQSIDRLYSNPSASDLLPVTAQRERKREKGNIQSNSASNYCALLHIVSSNASPLCRDVSLLRDMHARGTFSLSPFFLFCSLWLDTPYMIHLCSAPIHSLAQRTSTHTQDGLCYSDSHHPAALAQRSIPIKWQPGSLEAPSKRWRYPLFTPEQATPAQWSIREERILAQRSDTRHWGGVWEEHRPRGIVARG